MVEFWPTFAAILYFLGLALYYLKMLILFAITDQLESMSRYKVFFGALVWPIMTIHSVFLLMTTEGEE